MNISSVFIKGFVVAVLPAMISDCHSFKSVEQSAQLAQVQPAPAAFVLPVGQ